MRWFNIYYWKYLLKKPSYGFNIIKSFICRAKNHSNISWIANDEYTKSYRYCKNCGDIEFGAIYK